MPVVNMPDGTPVQFPDDMPQDQIRALILQKFPTAGRAAPAAQPQDGGDFWSNYVHPLAAGADDMLLHVPAMGSAAIRAGIHAATGQGAQGFADNYQQIRSEQQASAQHSPGMYTAGQVAGAVTAIPLLPEIGPEALAVKSGAPLLVNGGRLAARGAIGGAEYGAASGAQQGLVEDTGGHVTNADPEHVVGTVLRGTGEGAVGGALVAPVGAVATSAVQRLIQSATPAMRRSWQVLATKLGTTPDDVAARITDFQQRTGRAPTLAEIMTPQGAANVASDITSRTQSAQATAQNAQRASAEDLPVRLSNQVPVATAVAQPKPAPSITMAQYRANPQSPAAIAAKNIPPLRSGVTGAVTPGATATPEGLARARKEAMDRAMGAPDDPAALRNQPVPLSQDDVAFLQQPLIQKALANDQPLRQRLNGAVEQATDPRHTVFGGGQSALTVADAERLRLLLRNTQSNLYSVTNPRRNPQLAADYGKMADQVTAFAAHHQPAYGQALATDASNARFIAGFEHGRASTPLGDVNDVQDATNLRGQEGSAGRSVGQRTALVERAAASPASAATLVRDLAAPGAARAAVAENIGPGAATRMTGLAQAEQAGQENLRTLAGGSLQPESAAQGREIQGMVESAVAAGGHALTGFKAHVLSRIMQGRYVSAATAQRVTDLLFDPARTAEAVQALRRAGISNARLRQWMQAGATASVPAATNFIRGQFEE